MYNLSDGEEHVYGDGALGESSSARDDFDSVHLSDEDLQDDGDREDAGSNSMFIKFVYLLIVSVMSLEKS